MVLHMVRSDRACTSAHCTICSFSFSVDISRKNISNVYRKNRFSMLPNASGHHFANQLWSPCWQPHGEVVFPTASGDHVANHHWSPCGNCQPHVVTVLPAAIMLPAAIADRAANRQQWSGTSDRQQTVSHFLSVILWLSYDDRDSALVRRRFSSCFLHIHSFVNFSSHFNGLMLMLQGVSRRSIEPQSKELVRGPPELVQHFRL